MYVRKEKRYCYVGMSSIKRKLCGAKAKDHHCFFSRPSVFYYAFSSFHESVNIDLDSLIIVPLFFQCQFWFMEMCTSLSEFYFWIVANFAWKTWKLILGLLFHKSEFNKVKIFFWKDHTNLKSSPTCFWSSQNISILR